MKQVPIVSHPAYEAVLPDDHRFPMRKYGRLAEVIAEHTALTPGDVAWLEHLVAEWHLLADLAFSDLILWVPDVDDNVFWACAQVRPTTGPTALEDDVVGIRGEDVDQRRRHRRVHTRDQLALGLPGGRRSVPRPPCAPPPPDAACPGG